MSNALPDDTSPPRRVAGSTGGRSAGDAGIDDASAQHASTQDASTGDASTDDASTQDASTGDASTVQAETTLPDPDRTGRPTRQRIRSDEFFGHQPVGRASLPRPEPLLENLTRCVIEILAGARDLEQIARWVTDDVYGHLVKRVVISARARQAKGQRAVRPAIVIGSLTMCEPRDGVVEAVVIVSGRARTRAVAIRLEGMDSRWRATAINVL